MICDYGVESQIVLTGAQNRRKVAQLMSESDVLVSYSKLETFGVPIIEGWYTGIPAIATTAIGFAEYWMDSLGELIPFDEEILLEDALRSIKCKKESGYYSSDIIRNFAVTHFSEQAVYQRLMELYK